MKKHKTIGKKALKQEGQLTVAILLTLFSLLFIVVGIFILVLSLKTKDNKTTMVFGIASSILFVSVFSFFIYYTIKNFLRERKKKYFIAVDTLDHHKMLTKKEDDFKAVLYFTKYYDLYNKTVKITDDVKENTEDGEKYYLIISQQGLVHKVYNSKKYQISREIFDEVVKIEDLDEFTKLKNYNPDEKEEININRIIRDIYDDTAKDKKKMMVFINLLILIMSFTYCLLNIVIGLLLFIAYIVDSIILIVSLRREVKTINAIRNKKFRIKKIKMNKEEYYIVFLDSDEKLLAKYITDYNYLSDELEALL